MLSGDFLTLLDRKRTLRRHETTPELHELGRVSVDALDGVDSPPGRQDGADLPERARPVHRRRHHLQLVLQDGRYPRSCLRGAK